MHHCIHHSKNGKRYRTTSRIDLPREMSNEISHIQDQITEHRAQITHHRSQSTEHRSQSTEHRAQSTDGSHPHRASLPPAQSERINTWGGGSDTRQRHETRDTRHNTQYTRDT